MRPTILAAVLALAFGVMTACDPSVTQPDVNSASGPAFDRGASRRAEAAGSYEWYLTNGGAAWAPRAGLQVVQLDRSFYLMGGRSPRAPVGGVPIPGDSDIWADVWRSDDQGKSWRLVLDTGSPGHWPARAYFKAVGKAGFMYVLGGQNFNLIPNPICPPPFQGCQPFLSVSDFFNDVWRSRDGVDWQRMTEDSGWEPRAGLTSVVFKGEIYVFGGSRNDDSAIIGGPPARIYFNDVWKSRDGAHWVQVVENAPWAPRAGAAAVVKDGYIYLLGGEEGFLCQPVPFCTPPYFNDVWRSRDGATWELVTPSAAWAPRPGHQAAVIFNRIYLFGGFGQSQDPSDPFGPANPVDIWVSEDGTDWSLVTGSPWNATSAEEIKYDFAAVAVHGAGGGLRPSIFTFGGDRETFNFGDPGNYLRVDNDVWRFSPLGGDRAPTSASR